MVNTVRGTSSKICARNGEGDKIFGGRTSGIAGGRSGEQSLVSYCESRKNFE